MNSVFVLDVTQEDVEDLLRQAATARARKRDCFTYAGHVLYVAQIFMPDVSPAVRAIDCLHLIRQQDWDKGRYRGDKV